MTSLESLLSQPPVIRAGWTLVHFLWQGSAMAIVLAVVRGAAGSWLGARARYALSCLALALMCAAPPLTFIALGSIDPSAAPRPVWPISAPGSWDRILPWIVVAWFLGVVLFSARVFAGWRKAVRVRNAATEPPPPEWQQALEGLVRRMKVSAPVRLVMSPLATAPAVVGWLKPVILLPVEAMIGLPLDQVESLLAHELAHVRRNDYLVNILQSIAESLLFYHPAVWWISGQIRAERELCCDDLAVETSEDVLTYATALAALETFRRSHLKTAMAADGGSLLTRIRRLAGDTNSQPHSLPGPGAAWVLAILWLAGAGAVVMHASQSEPVRTLRPFIEPAISAAHRIQLDAPPAAPRSTPLLTALLFNPFLALPQTAAPSAAAGEEGKKLAAFSGTVISTAGKAVPNATVRLRNVETRSPLYDGSTGELISPAATFPVPVTRTDAEGRFSVDRVPPGAYTVEIEHDDYLTTRYGSRPGVQESPAVITLDEGGKVSGLKMTLPEPAMFTGRMVDEDGDPIARADVQALVKQYYFGRLRGVVYARTNSADDGSFRLNVPGGRYYLVATTQPAWSASDRAPIPVSKPGRTYVRPDTTFLGGARHLRDASQVDISPGQNFVVGDMKMANIPIVHVRGKVVGDPVLLKGARVVRVPVTGFALGWSYGADIQADGSFDMANMWPYEHTIGVYCQKGGWLGWLDIVVRDEDLENVVLNAAAADLAGSIRIEDAPEGAAAPRLRIELRSTGFYKVEAVAPVKPDGTFVAPSLAPGKYNFSVTGLPPGNYVRTARINGRDVLNQPLDWGAIDVGRMEISIGQKGPVLEGTLVDAEGNPVSGTVTLVPDTPRPGQSLFYPTAKADQAGKFRFTAVQPGSYKAYGWESLLDTAHWNQDFIALFSPQGERVEATAGNSQRIALKRISVDSMESTLRRAGK
jgi:beta-lactamase regulating signal transducer with metallopeptidase domain/protocatechuate 3,4-dioxygenase beta subunit